MKISGEIDSISSILDSKDYKYKPGIQFKISSWVLDIDALFNSMDMLVDLIVGQNIIVDCSIGYYSSYTIQLNNCSISN